ncbi:MAG: hypothetical protein Q9Q40_12415 [Acidobacteriota bacterium]|nr:hypothetical protein [Acidobacteriota bacterium]MDQ7088681.1 hypothetical protein [Acidobacteriota bacterium]
MGSLVKSRWLAGLLALAVVSASMLGALPHTHRQPAPADAGQHLSAPEPAQQAHPGSCIACLVSHAPSLDPQTPRAAAHRVDGVRLEAPASPPQPLRPLRLPQGRAPPAISL